MKLVKFVKGSAVKVTHDVYAPELAALGWTIEGADKQAEESKASPELTREALLAEAEALGLTVHHRTGNEKLAEMIAKVKAEA